MNRLIIRIVGAMVAAVALLSCSEPEPTPPEPSSRALLIGVDGASPKLIRSMMKNGELPNLSELARTGISGLLRPDYPLLSPRIWTSVATGKQPPKHGIKHWVRFDEDGRPRLYVSGDRTAHALWNIISDAGKTVGVVNWLVTHPPEKINGVMVTDHLVPGYTDEKLKLAGVFAKGFKNAKEDEEVVAPQRNAAYAYPEEWVERVGALYNDEQLRLVSTENPFASSDWNPDGLGATLRRDYASDQLVARTALAIDAAIRPDLLMVYLPGIDRVSHFIWDGFEPWEAMPPERRLLKISYEKSRQSLFAYYRFIDAVIGRLMEGRSPSDLVMVISDHGFELGLKEGEMRGSHNSDKARDGILFARGRGIPAGWEGQLLSMTDIAPTILAWFGLGPPDDMHGRPARFLRFAIPAPVQSYETTPIERLNEVPSDVEDTIIENLKELGYVE